MEAMNKHLPLLPLRGLTIFPNTVTHFDVIRKKSINSIEKAMVEKQYIFLTTQKNIRKDEPSYDDLYQVGTIAKIKQIVKLPKNIVRVLVEGVERAVLEELITSDKYYSAKIVHINNEEEIDNIDQKATVRIAKKLIKQYSKFNKKLGKDTMLKLLSTNDMGELADQIATNLAIDIDDKQKILEEIDPSSRLKLVIILLEEEIKIYEVKEKIQKEVKYKIDKSQKEYFLREQMKVIQDELGEGYNTEEEIEEYSSKIQKLKCSKKVKEKVSKELARLKKIPNSSSESVVVRNYIENIIEIPWGKMTKESKDITKAKEILENDHYGLDKIKERIIEYIAVKNFTKNNNNPILCLVGPPGTGKTSIAKSVAKALNKKYVRICLGGVKDESEIRGHRKTYIGAMPGRIIEGLTQAKTNNPLVLLDEIDKMSSDFRGDPSSALLEVLDPEQNKEFRDHYVELPIDLSNVTFIATANSVADIPRPLLDRMELIEVNSYTETEKMHIAYNYLIPKQIEKNGLEVEQFSISKNALSQVISLYTKEAGVRNLERKIAEMCRKAVKEIVSNKKKSLKVTEQNLEKYLGTPRYKYDLKLEEHEVGTVRGLAWTAVGGDTLSVEVNIMPGTGKLELTGKLGDVMKESGKAGVSYIRSKADKYNIDSNFYKEKDIHVHIPEGAVPKDGPSAGITMALAIISALTDRPVNSSIAMTGEITLRGKVLPIGGLKEKIIAAKRAGIEKVLIPKNNEKDIKEISSEVIKGIEISLVSTMDEVVEQALLG